MVLLKSKQVAPINVSFYRFKVKRKFNCMANEKTFVLDQLQLIISDDVVSLQVVGGS